MHLLITGERVNVTCILLVMIVLYSSDLVIVNVLAAMDQRQKTVTTELLMHRRTRTVHVCAMHHLSVRTAVINHPFQESVIINDLVDA